LQLFGSRTGTVERVREGERLSLAPGGFSWRHIWIGSPNIMRKPAPRCCPGRDMETPRFIRDRHNGLVDAEGNNFIS
jgi:hypothetical protein